jgi:hypothetical protein
VVPDFGDVLRQLQFLVKHLREYNPGRAVSSTSLAHQQSPIERVVAGVTFQLPLTQLRGPFGSESAIVPLLMSACERTYVLPAIKTVAWPVDELAKSVTFSQALKTLRAIFWQNSGRGWSRRCCWLREFGSVGRNGFNVSEFFKIRRNAVASDTCSLILRRRACGWCRASGGGVVRSITHFRAPKAVQLTIFFRKLCQGEMTLVMEAVAYDLELFWCLCETVIGVADGMEHFSA